MSALAKIHLAIFLFAVSGLLAKYLPVPVSTIVFCRAFFAAITLFGIMAWRRERLVPNLRDDLPLVALGAVLALHWWSFFYSIQISSVAVGLLTYSAFPMFVALLEPLISKKRLARFDVGAAAVIFFGLLLVVPEYDIRNQATLGAMWGVVSGLSFAVLQVINRRLVGSRSPVRITCIEITAAGIFLALAVPGAVYFPGGRDLLLLVFLGVVCTAFSHTLFVAALVSIRAETASIIAALEPVYGISLAALVLGEVPSLRTLVGGLIIIGTAVVTQRRG